jgi:histidinol-phosphatase
MPDDLTVALQLADVADQLSRAAFGSTSGERKADGSAVTAVDREIEARLRAELAELTPADAVVGEELGATVSGGGRLWILDPLDGTEYFLRGIPTWATMLALHDDDAPLVAVVSAPALGARWWASRGEGAFCNGRSLHVSKTTRLAESFAGHSNLFWPRPREDVLAGMTHTLLSARWSGGFEAFTGPMLVASGAIDATLTPVGKLWDHAPVTLIVEEAGGRVTDFDGRARPSEGPLLATNQVLHDEILAVIDAAS